LGKSKQGTRIPNKPTEDSKIRNVEENIALMLNIKEKCSGEKWQYPRDT
jgi:hypothetical protein